MLLVDDDATFRERLAKTMATRGYQVRTAQNHEQAVALATADSPEFAIIDLRMPGQSGLETARTLHRIDSTTKIVLLTGYGSIATAVDAIKHGAAHYLTKPATAPEILAALGEGGDADVSTNEAPDAPSETVIPSLARVEWEHIQRVLHDAGGNVTQAAKWLGVHRRSLQRKLSKFPVRR